MAENLGEKIFHIAEAQAEAMVDPDDIADDLRRKPMAMVTGFALVHRNRVPKDALK